MKKLYLAALLIVVSGALFAQQDPPPKYALVIGNGAYAGLGRLANPVNDADDVSAVLRDLGFSVDTLLNGGLSQMEEAVSRLRDNLKKSADAYGFFFYAGHGVQSNGENYLIPVDANIPSESYLRSRALSVQIILDDLNDARNSLNVVVLDACRDNPFAWSRSGGGRGLAMVSRQPAGSIIVYATSAGQQASDGEGRNGLFTGQLLNNLSAPGLEVNEVFRRTGADVSAASNNLQIPAIYSQFFGTAYLGEAGADGEYTPPARPPGVGAPRKKPDPAHLWTLGVSAGTSFAAPWVTTTARGTIAPFRHSFLELGMDLGLRHGTPGVGYYSLYPFAHYAFFMPFAKKGGWYAGAGGGVMIASYTFSDGSYSKTLPLAALTAGVNLLDIIDVSYAFRTNFTGVSHKVSVGYAYRFK